MAASRGSETKEPCVDSHESAPSGQRSKTCPLGQKPPVLAKKVRAWTRPLVKSISADRQRPKFSPIR